MFEDLALFDVLARYNATRVPDHHLTETAKSIRHWMKKALEERSGARARQALARVRADIKRAEKRSDTKAAVDIIYALPVRFWNLFREGMRISGANPLQRLPLNIERFEQALDIAIATPSLDDSDRRLKGQFRCLKRQLGYLFRCDPIDFRDHWQAMGEDEASRIEAVAQFHQIALWQDPLPSFSEMLIALDAAPVMVGRVPKSSMVHAYAILILNAQNLTGKRGWTNNTSGSIIPTGKLIDFIVGVLELFDPEPATHPRPSDYLKFSMTHFKSALKKLGVTKRKRVSDAALSASEMDKISEEIAVSAWEREDRTLRAIMCSVHATR